MLQELFGKQTEMTLDKITKLSRVNVDQFYGIELIEWPSRIAEVALWLMDHQMNLKVSEAFGQLYQRLPLKKSPHIHCGNALRLDWKKILPPEKCSYVLGNPPFVGKAFDDSRARGRHGNHLAEDQRDVVCLIMSRLVSQSGRIHPGTRIVVGFVSTNSISQGEQVGASGIRSFSASGSRFNLRTAHSHG